MLAPQMLATQLVAAQASNPDQQPDQPRRQEVTLSIHYSIKPVHPEAHLFKVSLTIAAPDPAGQKVSLPTWIPGSYMIRDFSRNIVEISASSGGQRVELTQLDKCTWQAETTDDELTITYTVYAWDLSVRTAHLDATHGFFNGTSVFLAVVDQEDMPCDVTLVPPTGEALVDWRVATTLPAVKLDDQGFGLYRADDYDELIDHPVEMGTFERAVFTACGVEHELVLTGKYTTDIERICQDLTLICEQHIRFFGEPAPIDRYVFLVMVVGDGYGGLEHRASTSLLIRRENLPVPGEQNISDDYLDFLGLCSHEYFHTWNVKRIKPAEFVPFKLQAESHTPLLWAFEGITSYYDDLALLECGLINRERYLLLLGRIITRVYRGSGRLKQSVAQSSFDAWTKFYKQDENAPNSVVSYYAKGAIVALSLDLLIRQKTNGEKSLQDLMRRLWQDYQATGAGIADNQFELLATELCGEDMSAFFKQAVYGTQDLPLDQYLADTGVTLTWRSSEGQDDRGGVASSKDNPVLSLSARTATAPGGLQLTHVFDGGAAQAAGLSAGDVLVALDELAVTPTSLERLLARRQVGDTLRVHAFRRDELMHASITLIEPPKDTCVLSVMKDDNRADRWLTPDAPA